MRIFAPFSAIKGSTLRIFPSIRSRCERWVEFLMTPNKTRGMMICQMMGREGEEKTPKQKEFFVPANKWRREEWLVKQQKRERREETMLLKVSHYKARRSRRRSVQESHQTIIIIIVIHDHRPSATRWTSVGFTWFKRYTFCWMNEWRYSNNRDHRIIESKRQWWLWADDDDGDIVVDSQVNVCIECDISTVIHMRHHIHCTVKAPQLLKRPR